MDESYYKDRISGYFDRSLPPDEHALVEEFLKNSEEGRRLLLELGRLDEFVRAQGELGGKDDFWERQAQSIEARLGFDSATPGNVTEIAPKAGRGLWWKLAAAAASIGFLVFIGLHEADVFVPDEETAQPTVQQSTPQPTPTKARQEQAGDSLSAGLRGESFEKNEDVVEEIAPAEGLAQNEVTELDIANPVESPEAAEEEKEQQVEPSTTVQTPEVAGDREVLHDITSATTDEFRAAEPAATPSAARARPMPVEDQRLAEVANLADTAVTLAHWRTEYAAAQESIVSKRRSPAQPSSKVLAESAFADRGRGTSGDSENERRLIEACFQIALLSTDTTEVRTMVEQLQRLSEHNTPTVRDYARTCLDSLRVIAE